MTLGDDLQCGPVDELSDALRAIEKLERDLVEARGRIAAYESELRDYGLTVKRLNGELAEARVKIELGRNEYLAMDKMIVNLMRNFDRLRAELDRAKAVLGGMEFEKVDELLTKPIEFCRKVGEVAHQRIEMLNWSGPIEPPEE